MKTLFRSSALVLTFPTLWFWRSLLSLEACEMCFETNASSSTVQKSMILHPISLICFRFTNFTFINFSQIQDSGRCCERHGVSAQLSTTNSASRFEASKYSGLLILFICVFSFSIFHHQFSRSITNSMHAFVTLDLHGYEQETEQWQSVEHVHTKRPRFVFFIYEPLICMLFLFIFFHF